ncbi:MAG: pseudouridine synthase [Alphaproteobacteria bacterium]
MEKQAKTKAFEGERLAKVIARSGVCSRRDAEKLIASGKVTVNNQKVESPALNVKNSDEIKIEGNLLNSPEKTRIWRFHKPKGIVTTNRDPQNRTTIFELLPKDMPRVVSVGRLDLNSEGLLLLTNDGELSRHLELPTTGWSRKYRVRVHGKVDAKKLEELEKGISFEGVNYGVAKVTVERTQGSNAWLVATIKEGKNREIRKIMESIGLEVTRLIRVSYGPFQLGNLAKGKVAEVPAKVIKEQLGKYLS